MSINSFYNQQTWQLGPYYIHQRVHPDQGSVVTLPLGNWNIEAGCDGKLCVKSDLSGKTFLTITEDEIIIGNPNGENITLKV